VNVCAMSLLNPSFRRLSGDARDALAASFPGGADERARRPFSSRSPVAA
jgi:hypothetical protein